MKEIIKEWGSYLLIIIVIVLLRKYIITPVIVKGTSMEPNLENNQILLLSKISYKLTDIKRFDIVVIQEDNDYIIKRVIGLPGETLEYQDNKLYINDKEIRDPYAKNKTTDFDVEDICEIRNDNCTMIIPEDKYIVLGDNRKVSADSRSKGLINKSEIAGKVVFRLWPLNKIKVIK